MTYSYRGESVAWFECSGCGCLVYDLSKHDQWHLELERVSKIAAAGDSIR